MTTKIGLSKERSLRLRELSESALGALRLKEPEELRRLEGSLSRHGQLEPLVVFRSGETFEVADGFKRLQIARQLGWRNLRVRVTKLDAQGAKFLLPELNGRRALSAIEEGWLVRSLHRDDGLSQGVIAERLRRHKTWVCRRLLLAEQVDGAVQAVVRLGLLAPKAAMALGVLPRGNQKAAADIVMRRGLTVRQTERLAADVLEGAGDSDIETRLAKWADGSRQQQGSAGARPRKVLSKADEIMRDIATLRGVGARLEARLLGAPLAGLGDGAEQVVRRGLEELALILPALSRTVQHVTCAGHRAKQRSS